MQTVDLAAAQPCVRRLLYEILILCNTGTITYTIQTALSVINGFSAEDLYIDDSVKKKPAAPSGTAGFFFYLSICNLFN